MNAKQYIQLRASSNLTLAGYHAEKQWKGPPQLVLQNVLWQWKQKRNDSRGQDITVARELSIQLRIEVPRYAVLLIPVLR